MSVLRRRAIACAAMLVVLLWQQGYVSPQSAVADDPLPPGYVDCGMGLVCGGQDDSVTAGDQELVVSGAEDRILQNRYPDGTFTAGSGADEATYVSPDRAWAYLETAAKAYVAAEHGVPNDLRITDWARDEVRAVMFNMLLQIAADPSNDVLEPGRRCDRIPDASDQLQCNNRRAYETLKALTFNARLDSALAARQLYTQWENNPCAFQWPDSVPNPNEYLQRSATIVNCQNIGGSGDFSSVPPPTVTEFAEGGAAQEFGALVGPEADDAMDNMRIAGIAFGALATLGIGVGAWAELSLFALSNALWIPRAIGTAWEYFALSPEIAVAMGGVTAAVSIIFAIIGAAAIGVSIWQFIEASSIPTKLDASVDNALHGPLDLSSYTTDPKLTSMLAAVFLRETLPDYSDPVYRVPGTPAHTSKDSSFVSVGHQDLGGNLVADPDTDTITPKGWEDPAVGHFVYVTDGWLSDQAGADTPHYTLKIKYFDWSGDKMVASIAGDTFYLADIDHPENSTDSPTIHYLDLAGALRTATLHTPHAPSIAPRMTGNFWEGQPIQFAANATDPDDPNLDVQWRIEDPRGQQILLEENGKTGLDRCYSDPLDKTLPAGDLFFRCPWPYAAGQSTQFTYTESGQFHVHLIATNDAGLTTSQVFQVDIDNVPPSMSDVGLVGSTVPPGGGDITVAGWVADAGEDPVAVQIDWGDGTVDRHYFPCNWAAAPPDPNICFGPNLDGNLRVVPAADPSRIFETHTYASDNNHTPWPITVTAFDDDGGESDAVALQTNVVPTLYVHCGDLTPPLIDTFSCDDRFGDTSYAVPLKGYFDDLGSQSWTLAVNWGDGHTDTLAYPCPSGQPCPFQTDSNIFAYLAQPGRVFFKPTHVYASPGNYSIGVSLTDLETDPVTDGAAAKISAPAGIQDPTISLTSPADGATYTVGDVVAADYSCADDVSVSSCSGPVADGANLDTLTVGLHTFTVNAQDNDGHTTTKTVHYTVAYPFTFDPSLVALPNANTWTAGQKLRIKFSLNGDQGTDVTRGLARHALVNCDTGQRLSKWKAGSLSKVAYRARNDQYYFVWFTKAAWAGTCRMLWLRMSDGTSQQLLFHFVAPGAASAETASRRL